MYDVELMVSGETGDTLELALDGEPVTLMQATQLSGALLLRLVAPGPFTATVVFDDSAALTQHAQPVEA